MQDSSSKQQTKHKYKPNNQQTVLPPHSVLLIREEKEKKKKPQKKAHPIQSLCKTLRYAETKRKKKFNLEAWEKETSNTICLKNNEKAEKYCTNEGTN